ncbi:MAG: hypothetical protein Q4E75_05595 [bacterium]|nr:hypothetical protein [bacterium]
MTEEEAKKALFDLNYEYMSHSPKERLILYDDYRKKRAEIRNALKDFVCGKVESEKKL